MDKKKTKVEKEKNTKNKKTLIISLCGAFLAFILVVSAVLAVCLTQPKANDNKMFSCGLLAVEFNDGWGYVNEKGETKIAGQFTEATPFSENGLALVGVNGMYGFINTRGEFEINPMYTEAKPFQDGSKLTVVKRNMKYGFINKDGEEIIPCQYEYVDEFSNGLALIKVGSKFGFINEKGRFVINPVYDRAESFSNKKVTSVGKLKDGEYIYACISNKGELLTEFAYKKLEVSQEYIITFDGTYYGFSKLDLVPLFKTEQQILDFPIQLDSFKNLKEGLIPFRANDTNKFGFLNLDGTIVISPNYDVVGNFYDGLAMIKKDNCYGFINLKGELIVNNKYGIVRNYHENHAIVAREIDGKMRYGIINNNGKVVVDLVYSELGDVVNGLSYFATFDSENIGYLSVENKVVVSQDYNKINSVSAYDFSDDGYAVVKQGNKFGVIDKSSKFIVGPYLLNVAY